MTDHPAATATLRAWADEMTAEMTALGRELAAAVEELAVIEAEAQAARQQREAIAEALGQRDLASSLVQRRRQHDDELRAVIARPRVAAQAIATLRARISDLAQSIGQIEAVKPPVLAPAEAELVDA